MSDEDRKTAAALIKQSINAEGKLDLKKLAHLTDTYAHTVAPKTSGWSTAVANGEAADYINDYIKGPIVRAEREVLGLEKPRTNTYNSVVEHAVGAISHKLSPEKMPETGLVVVKAPAHYDASKSMNEQGYVFGTPMFKAKYEAAETLKHHDVKQTSVDALQTPPHGAPAKPHTGRG